MGLFARRREDGWWAVGAIAALVGLLLCISPGTVQAAVVTDMLGRPVAIPERPLRLVSLAPSITETIFALGRGGWLVGVTAVCDFPAAARALPKVGGIAAPSLEQIVRLRPDLVFATAEGNARDLLDQLERLGLATFALRPDSYGGVVQSILAVGRVSRRIRPPAASWTIWSETCARCGSESPDGHDPASSI